MSELKWNWVYYPYLDAPNKQEESALKAGYIKVVEKSEADKVIADLEESHKMEVGQLLMEIAEQKAKASTLLGCLKYLVMRDLIKDCPPKKVAAEIVKEYDNGLG